MSVSLLTRRPGLTLQAKFLLGFPNTKYYLIRGAEGPRLTVPRLLGGLKKQALNSDLAITSWSTACGLF